MKLEDIGFYSLSEQRCKTATPSSALQRCELVLTSRCNFKCPYCRHVGGPDLPFADAAEVVKLWCSQGLRCIRFSGGEPTLYPGIYDLVAMARDLGCYAIAISTNGSADWEVYERLIQCGVTDFSVSLDACCAADGDRMAGVPGMWGKVVDNISRMSDTGQCYVSVGVVLTEQNADSVHNIIKYADNLGVHDIRVIPAAQDGDTLVNIQLDQYLTGSHPILDYRINNLNAGKKVRGLCSTDSRRCGLVLDDMAVCQGEHYPCIIYMREGGRPIGKIGPNVRQERAEWYINHDTHADPICSKNCLDVCTLYNNKFRDYRKDF